MKLQFTRQKLAVGLVLLVFLLPLALAATYFVGKYQWAERAMAELEPRYARLLGLQSIQPELTQAIAQSAALVAVEVYPATQDVSQAGNDAQQRIRNIATRAGLSIMSSQVLPPKADKQFDRVPLSVRLEGELPALQAALVVLAAESPSINFESFSVQTIGAVKPEVAQRLNIQFNLFILRARS
jgi:general secretion pathway protein M